MKKLLVSVLLLLVALVGYILFKTFTFSSKQLEVALVEKIDVPASATAHLQEALRLKTISFEDPAKFDSSQFSLFNAFLKTTYPLADSLLEHRVFNGFSHLYKWEGSHTELKPMVLMGHIDVVPIASPEKWTVEPFEGQIKDGKIWGRGTIDDKFSVVGIMEAVELLLAEGFQPKRTLYLAFGHDEEVGGELGAKTIASFLKNQGIEAEYVLDEGYAITQGLVPGVDRDVAMIGVAEKGSTTIEFTVDMEGGHSSQPAKETAIDVLAGAVAKLKAEPLPASISDAMQGFIEQLGPEMGFINKMAFANRKLFSSLIVTTYENASNAGNALVRTTTAPTIFEAGIKENVIPTTARALVNFRIIPGQTAEEVLKHAIEVIDDNRVKARFYGFNSNPSPVSPTDSKGYEWINRSIKQIFEDTHTAPNLVIGATDARHFSLISKHVYRFVPYHVNEDNINTFHGIDEHILLEDYANAIRFYRQLILNSN
ncbi:M20 family peptidase [Roseivirga sp. UBA838]|uniref:M20 family peptidase n=1 Tax=Roseivirga sp. UBA838 TaxID=1947393 RepID=UPI002580CC15|nr:M20 family peptidase [Roseivirga sp. UBA838]|tara:strand:+ start:15233 stop:16684 length:1452 start_codon:yes stop_codon:yes gene_type:complete